MRRIVSNVEVEPADNDEVVVQSNFILAELSVQARHEMHWWVGRATHRLRRVNGELRMALKKVVLVNAAEPLPNLTFLI
jgi:3-phenylpropionate/cinnamic acid dioxygenase small subunit